MSEDDIGKVEVGFTFAPRPPREMPKPCPFCGDTRVEFNSGWKCYRVECGAVGPTYSDPDKATERWNRRPSEETLLDIAYRVLPYLEDLIEDAGGEDGPGRFYKSPALKALLNLVKDGIKYAEARSVGE